MESELSGSDGDASLSESGDKELEDELFSVLHYSDFSGGVPEELKKKYDIVLNGNECCIQLKSSDHEESGSGEEPKTNTADDSVLLNESSSSCESSSSEVVIIERDPFLISKNTPSASSPAYETLSSDMSSDDDSSDLIILEDPNRRSPILLSDDEDDLQINLDPIDEENGSVSDGQVSDVGGRRYSYDWKSVSSPSTWSDSMRKYYNRPCSTLRYFDFRKIKDELMKAKGAKWYINNGDKFNVNIPRRRCHICRQPGHVAQTCPKRNPVCLMCGTEGHTRRECPDSKCLNCGRQAGSYVTMCNRCRKSSGTTTCFTCQQIGHWAKECPNNWRQFHSITGDVASRSPKSIATVNPNANCSNCGEQGHFYEKCRKGYFSPYPPVSCLVVQTGDDRTRQTTNGPPPKKRKMDSGPEGNGPRGGAQHERKRSRQERPGGKDDFLRHLGPPRARPRSHSTPRPDRVSRRSRKRKQRRYFNLTA